MDLHLLGIAHNPLGPEHCRDPFGELVWVFGKALRSAGHRVILYGAAGTDTTCCDDFVECVGADTLARVYGARDKVNHQFDAGQGWDGADDAWREFKMRAAWALESRIRDKAPAVILASVGWALVDFCAPFMGKHLVVEPLIGYNHTFAEHRVFPSHAWRHYTMGDDVAQKRANGGSPSRKDTVIPHPIDIESFEFCADKADYAMFLGRVNATKGVLFAVDACKKAGMPLKVVGQLPAEPEGSQLRKQIEAGGAEWVPSVGPKERSAMLGKARALLAPTVYCEPFGMVAPQAMACGTPVICTAWGGVSESVVHGYTGYHCDTVADAVAALRQVDRIRPEVCRAWAGARFGIQPVGQQYDAYLRLIAGEADVPLVRLHQPHPLEVIAALAQQASPQSAGECSQPACPSQ